MLELSSKIATLPIELQQRLSVFQSLPLFERQVLRSEVLKRVISPTNALRAASLGLAYFISTKYTFASQEKQLEIAGALIGGHLGYYSVEFIKKSDMYIATPLEESLVAALGGLYGTNFIIANKGRASSNSPLVQTYNLYVLLTHLVPIMLRARYIKEFDSLFLTQVQ
jgi:hypothetical protein